MGAVIQFRQGATLLNFPAAQCARGSLTTALKRHRLPEHLIETLVREAACCPDLSSEEALAVSLNKRMRLKPIDFEKARGLVLVGPSGAGKSAVAEKIAHMAQLSGRRVELAHAADGLALFRTATFDGDGLMVMEARGFNPANRRALSAFAAIGSAGGGEAQGAESLGVVSAASDAEDVWEIVTALRPPKIIVTGLDRTSRLGAAVAAVIAGPALAHVTYGPRPDDPLETLPPDLLAKMLLD
jgi:flagellar biosynthesis protein FlhF